MLIAFLEHLGFAVTRPIRATFGCLTGQHRRISFVRAAMTVAVAASATQFAVTYHQGRLNDALWYLSFSVFVTFGQAPLAFAAAAATDRRERGGGDAVSPVEAAGLAMAVIWSVLVPVVMAVALAADGSPAERIPHVVYAAAMYFGSWAAIDPHGGSRRSLTADLRHPLPSRQQRAVVPARN